MDYRQHALNKHKGLSGFAGFVLLIIFVLIRNGSVMNSLTFVSANRWHTLTQRPWQVSKKLIITVSEF